MSGSDVHICIWPDDFYRKSSILEASSVADMQVSFERKALLIMSVNSDAGQGRSFRNGNCEMWSAFIFVSVPHSAI